MTVTFSAGADYQGHLIYRCAMCGRHRRLGDSAGPFGGYDGKRPGCSKAL